MHKTHHFRLGNRNFFAEKAQPPPRLIHIPQPSRRLRRFDRRPSIPDLPLTRPNPASQFTPSHPVQQYLSHVPSSHYRLNSHSTCFIVTAFYSMLSRIVSVISIINCLMLTPSVKNQCYPHSRGITAAVIAVLKRYDHHSTIVIHN